MRYLLYVTHTAIYAIAAIMAFMICCSTDCLASQSDAFGKIDYDRFMRENHGREIKNMIDDARDRRQRERYDSAAAYYSIVSSLYSESLPEADIRRCAIAYVNLGYILQAWHMNSTEAYSCLMNAREIASRHGFKDVETSITSNLGQIYLDYNDFPKAAEYLRKTVMEIIDQKADIYYGIALTDFVMAALFDEGRLLDVETTGRLKSYRPSPDAPLYKFSAMLADVADRYSHGDMEGALEILGRPDMVPDVDTDAERYEIMRSLILGKLLILSGRNGEAVEALENVAGICSKKGYLNLLEKCYTLLMDAAGRAGDRKAGEGYRLRVLELRDSLFNASAYGTVKDLESAGAMAKMSEKVRDAVTRATRQRQITLVSLAAVVVLLALFIWLYISNRKIKNAYAEIFRKNMELSRHYIADTGADVGKDAGPGVSRESSAAAGEEVSHGTDECRGLLSRVMEVMASSAAIYDPDFSIETLADLLGSRPKAVSHAINSVSGKNFNTLLGEYRIRKACVLLADATGMKTMTMESVAEAVGYRSRTYFSRIFKEVTGLTPTQFSREARAAHDSQRLAPDP